VLFHIKCPECGSSILKAGTPTAADANSAFDKAITDIRLLGATPEMEASSSKEQSNYSACMDTNWPSKKSGGNARATAPPAADNST
jgi:hypothetical protein